jgi:coxsackievirus/adenovirus receptor
VPKVTSSGQLVVSGKGGMSGAGGASNKGVASSAMSGPLYECKCPTRCPSYGDDAGSRPVCGSDGRDYTNLCQLRRAACHLKSDIRIKYRGTCDPCATQPCNEGGVCQLDARRQPICRCSTICNLEFKPVCASDGRTYANQCIMEVEGCKAKKSLRMIYKGECSSGEKWNVPCNKAF